MFKGKKPKTDILSGYPNIFEIQNPHEEGTLEHLLWEKPLSYFNDVGTIIKYRGKRPKGVL